MKGVRLGLAVLLAAQLAAALMLAGGRDPEGSRVPVPLLAGGESGVDRIVSILPIPTSPSGVPSGTGTTHDETWLPGLLACSSRRMLTGAAIRKSRLAGSTRRRKR